MLDLQPIVGQRPLKVVCLGAHCDDIELGCGATVRQLVMAGTDVEIHWHVLSSDPTREEEARCSAGRFLAGVGKAHVDIQKFRNGYFPYIGAEVKDYFEQIKATVNPDIVFTHYCGDLHQDHRLVGELSWNTFRNNWILEYEIPKYDGDIGAPNFFHPVSAEVADFKMSTIVECFASQRAKSWFDRETFAALMRLRGMECNAESFLAEAFYCRKAIVGCFDRRERSE